MLNLDELEKEARESFNEKMVKHPLIYDKSHETAYVLGWFGCAYEQLRKEIIKLKKQEL